MSEIEERGVPIEEPEEEQPESEEEEEEVKESRPLPPFVKLLILLAAALVLAAGAFFVTKKVVLPRVTKSSVGEKMTEVKQKLQKPKKKKKEKKGPVIRHPIMGITANTAGSLGRRFITLDLMVETTSEESQQEMVEKEYQIRDALIFYFGGRSVQEISTRQFMVTARDTVRGIINSVLESEPVDTVFFTTFLIQ
jgi:flagellar basal body-associated protein FliL